MSLAAVPPSPALSGASVCVFDADGTLFDLSSIAEKGRHALGDRVLPLLELWRAKQLEYTWLRSLMGRHGDFWRVTGEALDFALRVFAIDDPGLRAALMEGWMAPRAYADALPALHALRAAGIRCSILSNGTPVMLTSALSASGLYGQFDAVLSVEQVAVYKPHPSVYKLVCDRFSQLPEQVAFVSANGWDVAGASAFGFKVAWINRRASPPEALPAQPTTVITALSELPHLLGA